MAVTWEPYLEIPPIASEADVALVEQALGVRFPTDYRAVLMAHQGQGPEPCAFDVGQGNDVFSCLFHATTGHGDDQYSILANNNPYYTEEYVPRGVFAIAETPGGNKICLDYRANADAPTMVHWEHEDIKEESIRPLAASFSALLDALYEPDDRI